jgi:hypothetical protein
MARLTTFAFKRPEFFLINSYSYVTCSQCSAEAANVTLPEREAFHIFRHTYGSWMRRYGRVDPKGLVATGAWKSEQSASRYAHAVVSEEAQKSDMLPKIKFS